MQDSFALMLDKVRKGKCCILTCSNDSDLIFYARHEAPILCGHHLHDGTDTHAGQYEQTDNPYYMKWTCCGDVWKMSKCRKLTERFDQHAAEIPVTQAQRERADVRQQQADIAEEERRCLEAQYHAGHDEYYDR